jgi:hypothetical protein
MVVNQIVGIRLESFEVKRSKVDVQLGGAKI